MLAAAVAAHLVAVDIIPEEPVVLAAVVLVLHHIQHHHKILLLVPLILAAGAVAVVVTENQAAVDLLVAPVLSSFAILILIQLAQQPDRQLLLPAVGTKFMCLTVLALLCGTHNYGVLCTTQ